MGRSIVQELKVFLRLVLAWSRRLSSTRLLSLLRNLWRWLCMLKANGQTRRKRGGDDESADIPQLENTVRINGAAEAVYSSRVPAALSNIGIGRLRDPDCQTLQVSTSNTPYALPDRTSEGEESPYTFNFVNPSKDSVASSQLSYGQSGSPRSERSSGADSAPHSASSRRATPRRNKDDRLSRLVTASDSRRHSRPQSIQRSPTSTASTTSLSQTLHHGACSRASVASGKANVASPAGQLGIPRRYQKTYPILETDRYDRPDKLYVVQAGR